MAYQRQRDTAADLPTLVGMEGPRAFARREAEAFVSAAFEAAYGANITRFMPDLMTLRSDAGRLLAVLGLRSPTNGPLFLEHYLPRPVEDLLAQATGAPVARASLVEVGNFAVGAAGGGRWLITALTAYLFASGRAWAVFTCGPELQNAFRRLGVELVDLAPASRADLPPDDQAHWGRYYDQHPRVKAANVAQSYRVLSAAYAGECALNALWHDALSAGRLAA